MSDPEIRRLVSNSLDAIMRQAEMVQGDDVRISDTLSAGITTAARYARADGAHDDVISTMRELRSHLGAMSPSSTRRFNEAFLALAAAATRVKTDGVASLRDAQRALIDTCAEILGH